MANGHVEIYDPLSNKDGQKSSVDGSDDDDGADGMEGTLEFKLLMVYTKRRRDEHDGGQTPEPKGPPVENLSNFDNNVTDKKKGKKKKKKKGFKKFFKFSCIKPKTSDDDVGQESCAPEPESDNRMLIPRKYRHTGTYIWYTLYIYITVLLFIGSHFCDSLSSSKTL